MKHKVCVEKMHSLLFHPFPLFCKFDARQLQTEDPFHELFSVAGEVQEDCVIQHRVERVWVQQHRHVMTSNTDLGGGHHFSCSNTLLS